MSKRALAVPGKGSTGPRTVEGKNRAKLNAVKHGIFAAVVLKSESHEEYQKLFEDLANSLQPVGKLEEILVEKLAVAVWRYRRLLQAESAEIAKARMDRQPGVGTRIANIELANALWGDRGSIAKAFLSHDEGSLAFDINTLKQLRDKVQQEGLDWERDREVIFGLYGRTPEEIPPANSEMGTAGNSKGQADMVRETPWVAEYRTLSQQPDDADRRSKSQAAKQLVQKLTEQIDFFKDEFMRVHLDKEEMKELQATACLVPKENTELLLRYEGGLERAFDRTLSQLERLQRMRLGQPTLPPLRIDVAS